MKQFIELEEVYSALPESSCMKTSCSNFCCTKMESGLDINGMFMPLPMVYGVEYLNILEYIKTKFPGIPPHVQFDFSKQTRLCPFKDPSTHRCMIYEARPFSCRIYGRRVPPVFWGVEIAPALAASIYCDNLKITEPEKNMDFFKQYPEMWDTLACLSLLYNPFTLPVNSIIKESTGIPTLTLLAFGEFYFLSGQSIEWFENNFRSYWEKTGNLL